MCTGNCDFIVLPFQSTYSADRGKKKERRPTDAAATLLPVQLRLITVYRLIYRRRCVCRFVRNVRSSFPCPTHHFKTNRNPIDRYYCTPLLCTARETTAYYYYYVQRRCCGTPDPRAPAEAIPIVYKRFTGLNFNDVSIRRPYTRSVFRMTTIDII